MDLVPTKGSFASKVFGISNADEEPEEQPYTPNRAERRAMQKKRRAQQRRGQRAFERARKARAAAARDSALRRAREESL